MRITILQLAILMGKGQSLIFTYSLFHYTRNTYKSILACGFCEDNSSIVKFY
jgi:hypothetical protein